MLSSNIHSININLKFIYFFLRILIRAGANVNAVDNDGWTPLHAAAHWNKHHVIQYLIEQNADLNATNSSVEIFYLFFKSKI